MPTDEEKAENASPEASRPEGGWSLPRIFGRYLLIHRISRGGMGEIFLARYGLEGFEKLAVIKKVLPHLAADEEFIARFVTEAQVAVQLQHANIAQVFEVGRVGDEYFLALENIHGRDLRRTVSLLADSGRGMPPDLALFIAREVANALAYAHRRVDENGDRLGLVHCDISPPNVMMSFEGEVKIIDFGIAKSALAAMDADSKQGFGKFGYMAPEQLIAGREVDARTDIYALGSVLFEMLTGTRLYALGETPDYRALAKMVSKGQHPLPSDHDPALEPFDELVARALRPKAGDRYATAAQFRDAIQRHLVELNPTISSDELASFMRYMFAEDVLRQAEEIDRLDKTQLSHWESEAGSVAQQTVSFALGDAFDLTSDPSSLTGGVDLGDALAAREDLTDALEDNDKTAVAIRQDDEVVTKKDADRTALVSRELDDPDESRRKPLALWITAAAVLVLGIGGAFAWSQRGGEDGEQTAKVRDGQVPPEFTNQPEPKPSPMTMPAPDPSNAPEPLKVPTPKPSNAPESVPTPAPAPAIAPANKASKAPAPEPESAPEVVKSLKSEEPSGREAGDDEETRPDAAVIADAKRKFKGANREYKKFRAKHGGQLHGEWTSILQFATFAANDKTKSTALVRKIDRFRAKMRQIERDTL